jgi:hypothetical protein
MAAAAAAAAAATAAEGGLIMILSDGSSKPPPATTADTHTPDCNTFLERQPLSCTHSVTSTQHAPLTLLTNTAVMRSRGPGGGGDRATSFVVAKSNSGEAAQQGGGGHTYAIPPHNMACKKACLSPRREVQMPPVAPAAGEVDPCDNAPRADVRMH